MAMTTGTKLFGKAAWRWVALVIALTLLMIYVFVKKGEEAGFEWTLFVSTLKRLDWRWLALSAAICLATYVGRALRWAVLLKPVRPDPSLWGLISATTIGFTALVLLGRPGEFVRPYLIAVKERVPVSSQLAAWLLERILDLLVAMLVFGIALSQVRASGLSVGPALSWVLATGGWLVGITCAASLAILLLIRHFADRMRNRLLDALAFLPERHYATVQRLVTAFVQGVESTRSDRAMLLLAGYTLLEWALIVLCYYAVAKAFGAVIDFGILDVLIFMGFVSFGSLVQLPGIGGGVQVVTVVVLVELFHAPLEIATSMALMIWIVTFVVVVPFGLVLSIHEGLSWARLRKLEKEADW
jgi:uncharacterized protein (TIRG00374 family)